MGREQDDVDRDARREDVLLVGLRIARERRRDDDERRRAVELRASFGPPTSFSRASVSGPTTRKRQGWVSLWFGAEAREVEQLLDRSRAAPVRVWNCLWVRRLRIASEPSTWSSGLQVS